MAKKKKKTMDPHQRELQELIELKKMQQAAAEHPELQTPALFPKEEEIVPKTFKEKWQNYWYHYKVTTWISVCAIVMVSLLIKDIFFGPKYDLSITTATPFAFSALNDNIAGDMAEYVTKDYNGDEKINVTYDEIVVDFDVDSPTDPQMNAINMQKLMAVIASGEDLVYILEDRSYSAITEDDGSIFVDFSEIYGDLDLDIVQGDKILLNDTKLGKKMFINKLDDDVYICMRELGGSANPDSKKVQQANEVGRDFIDNLLRAEYPDKFPEQAD